jgi:hypothetical protein
MSPAEFLECDDGTDTRHEIDGRPCVAYHIGDQPKPRGRVVDAGIIPANRADRLRRGGAAQIQQLRPEKATQSFSSACASASVGLSLPRGMVCIVIGER